MPRSRSVFFALIVISAIGGLHLPAWAEEGEQVRSIIVFTYYNQHADPGNRFTYLSYAIPDIIRESLIDRNLLYVLEKSQVDRAAREIGAGDSYHREEALRLKTSRLLAADYFVWGYYFLEGERLFLMHHVVETATGRTVKMAKGEYSSGTALFDEVDLSAREFARYLNRELPVRVPDDDAIYVDPADGGGKTLSIGLGGFFNFYQPQYYSDLLEPSLGLMLDVCVYMPQLKPFYFGIFLPLTLVKSREGAALDTEVLLIPFLVKFGIEWRPVSFLGLELALFAGGVIVDGYHEPDEFLYTRFAFGADANISFTIAGTFYIAIGLHYTCIPDFYETVMIHLFNPQISAGFIL